MNKNIIENPGLYFTYLLGRLLKGSIKADARYLEILYNYKMGKKLDLDNPITYNEKLQWLKLYDKNPLYTKLVDKYEVRKYISEKIGDKYLIPLIGVWNSFDEINFDLLPNQFVLKCTHDSGGLVICKDKTKLNINEVRKKLERGLRRNYFTNTREWPYKNVKPRIIAEKYMVDESGIQLKDYKIFCFDGEPKTLFVATDRGIDTKFDFFDINFKKISVKQHYDNSHKSINKPQGFKTMLELSKKLSQDMPHVRIDFYDICGKVYFGEMTFYHFSGLERFEPESYDYEFGKWISLPKMIK